MDRLKRLAVEPATEADLPAVYRIFEGRPGAWRPGFQVFAGSSLLVVREGEAAVCAFAIVRADYEQRQYTVDALECERNERGATVRGICALQVFGAWFERFVAGHGGGDIFSCVGADNRVHEQALLKSGYSDRVHVLSKRIEGGV